MLSVIRYEELEKFNTQILRLSTDIVLSLFSSDGFFIFSFFWKILINELISNLVFSWGEALLNKIPIKWNIFEHLTKFIAQSYGVLIPGQVPYFYTSFLDSVDCLDCLPALCSHHFFLIKIRCHYFSCLFHCGGNSFAYFLKLIVKGLDTYLLPGYNRQLH